MRSCTSGHDDSTSRSCGPGAERNSSSVQRNCVNETTGDTITNSDGSITHIPPNWEWEKWGKHYNKGLATMAGTNYDNIGLFRLNARRTSGYLTNDPRNTEKKEKPRIKDSEFFGALNKVPGLEQYCDHIDAYDLDQAEIGFD